MITTGKIAKMLYPGVRTWYGLEYRQLQKEYPKIFEQLNTERSFEEVVGLVGTGLASIKQENSGITYTDMEQGLIKTYRPITYALGYTISFESIINNVYKQKARQFTRALARSMVHTREHVHANVLNRSYTAGYHGADGVPLCASNHPYQAGGGTFSNILSPAIAFSELAIEEMCIMLAGFRDDAGLLIAAMPKQLIIPPALKYQACRILESTLQAETSNNAINALKKSNSIPGGFQVVHRLSSTKRFFLQTDVPNGLQTYNRYKSGPRQDSVFDTMSVKYAEVDIYDCGWTDPRCLVGSNAA